MTGPSHDDANRTPTEERATDLLQRFFNRTLTEKEAGELLKYWNARPELHGDALDHFDTETLLPFLAAPRTLPPGRLDEWIDAACRRFDRPTEIGFDADELARLAAASPALPKPEPENEKIAARETRKRPVEAYDAAQTSGSHRTLAVLLPLILAAFMVAVYVEWSSTRKTSDDDFPLAKERPTPAILVDRDDVRWTAGTRPPELGEPLLPGVLAMESGTIELLFYNGVRGIVEGPAELIFLIFGE